jgi:magnesium transporter
MKKTERRRAEAGAPPGFDPETVAAAPPPHIEIIDYTPESVRQEAGTATPEALVAPAAGVTRWIRITGVPDAAMLQALGDSFGLHTLVLEDLASTDQRIKVEDFETYSYTVLRTLHHRSGEAATEAELDLVLAGNVFITVDEGGPEGFFEPIVKRLQNPLSLLRRSGADMLYYAVFDLAVDCFFPLVELYEEEAELMSESISASSADHHVGDVHQLRASINHARATLWATRDAASTIERNPLPGLSEQTQFYFRDIHDHVTGLLDSVMALRETATGLRELHMARMSNRMNEIMKVLTIISTVFIPITFIAGIFGMNFVHMPELGLRWTYPATLGLMALIAVGMLIFFRRRKWL